MDNEFAKQISSNRFKKICETQKGKIQIKPYEAQCSNSSENQKEKKKTLQISNIVEKEDTNYTVRTIRPIGYLREKDFEAA